MKDRFGTIVCVCGMAVTIGSTMPVMGDNNFWRGPDGGLFSNPTNWTLNRVPNSGDVAINLIGGGIQFDMDSIFPVTEYEVAGFAAASNGGSLTLRSLAPVNPQPSWLHSQGAVNYTDWQTQPPYTINVGDDVFTIGARRKNVNPVSNVGTFGFDWAITPQTRAQIMVAGTVGPGTWLAQGNGNTFVNIGYYLPDLGGGDRIMGPNGFTDGLIDSQVTSEIFFPGRSTWTFQGVKFCAQRCENLDFWYANRGPMNVPNHLQMFEYFEARWFFFQGNAGPDLLESSYVTAAAPESGLRVLQFMGLSGTNPAGNDGPWLWAGEMLVKRQAPTDAPAVVRIEDASQVWVVQFLSDRQPQIVEPRFDDASILQYGTKHTLYDPESVE